jgi:hypothetical protein
VTVSRGVLEPRTSGPVAPPHASPGPFARAPLFCKNKMAAAGRGARAHPIVRRKRPAMDHRGEASRLDSQNARSHGPSLNPPPHPPLDLARASGPSCAQLRSYGAREKCLGLQTNGAAPPISAEGHRDNWIRALLRQRERAKR